SSTCNTRIERLWVEVGTQFARRWRAFFTRLENHHGLGPHIPSHICPKDLRFLGQVQFGMYQDDCEGIHPNIIEEYYGVDGHTATQRQHQTRAGHPADKEDSDNDEEPQNIVRAISDEQRDHIHHEAINVPSQRNPFINDETHQQFFATLAEVVAEDITPHHCRLAVDEWEGNEYPIFETIPVGQRGSKELHVSLAESIWFK
ncbi:hypothetical protein EDB19DRAFT_1639040, partial [Suillus lakei]